MDEVIPEPAGGAHNNHEETAANLKRVIVEQLREVSKLPLETLLARRYEKFRKIGEFAGDGA